MNITIYGLGGKVFEIKQVQIDREKFLRKAFRELPEDKIEKLLSEGPPAVLSSGGLDKAAKRVISNNRNRNALGAHMLRSGQQHLN